MTEKFAFPEVEIGQILEKVTNPVKVELNRKYVQIGIRSHGKGLFDKEEVTGDELGNKRVFWIEPDCFVVNIVFAWEQAVGRTTKDDIGKIASHRFPMYRPKNGKADIDFISYLFKTKYGKELLTLASPGGAGRNKTLGQSEFAKLKIRVPSGVEQKKIAEILKTWDDAIETVEKLIANAMNQKKSLAQKLLTGNVRLSGFSKKWEAVPVNKMGKTSSGGTPDSDEPTFWDGDVVWATPTDITSLENKYIKVTKRQISEMGLKNCSTKKLPRGTLLICTRATIGEMAIAATPMCTNQGFKNLEPNKSFDVEFLFYLFQHNKKELIRRSCGSTFLELSKSDFDKLSFVVPDYDEQIAITTIINSADLKIEKFKEASKLLREEKSALMQQLLTGKRRVKIDKEDMAA